VVYVVYKLPTVRGPDSNSTLPPQTKRVTPVSRPHVYHQFDDEDLPKLIPNTASDKEFPGWMTLIFGVIAGFILLWLVTILKPNKGIAIVTLLLSAASTCSFFSYFFIKDLKGTSMFFVLGLAGGVMVYMMFFPVSSIFG
jgi:hypothetical protein